MTRHRVKLRGFHLADKIFCTYDDSGARPDGTVAIEMWEEGEKYSKYKQGLQLLQESTDIPMSEILHRVEFSCSPEHWWKPLGWFWIDLEQLKKETEGDKKVQEHENLTCY